MLFAFGALALSALPALPEAYTAHSTWAECGNVGKCIIPTDHRVSSTDGETIMAEVMTILISKPPGKVSHYVTTTPAVYQWTDGQHDCDTQSYGYPIQGDWAWVGYNTTTSGPAPCVTDPSAKCTLWQGPWPEQTTSLVKLWLRPGDVPDSIEMHCSLFPFSALAHASNPRPKFGL